MKWWVVGERQTKFRAELSHSSDFSSVLGRNLNMEIYIEFLNWKTIFLYFVASSLPLVLLVLHPMKISQQSVTLQWRAFQNSKYKRIQWQYRIYVRDFTMWLLTTDKGYLNIFIFMICFAHFSAICNSPSANFPRKSVKSLVENRIRFKLNFEFQLLFQRAPHRQL